MRILVDTNVFLEILLGQAKITEARNLLAMSDRHELFMSDFALHSIALLLTQRKQVEVLAEQVLTLPARDLKRSLTAIAETGLDFDDAYQYALAQAHDLRIVSFDADFDGTPLGRLLPEQIL